MFKDNNKMQTQSRILVRENKKPQWPFAKAHYGILIYAVRVLVSIKIDSQVGWSLTFSHHPVLGLVCQKQVDRIFFWTFRGAQLMAGTIQLNAGFATVGQGAGPMIVTERAGVFRKYGLAVNIRMMGGATGVVRGLLAGEIQFGNLAAPALLRAVLEGKPDMVFLTGGINQQFLMTRPAIVQREQLANGTIGMAGDNGLNDLLVHFIVDQLEAAGIRNLRKVPVVGGGRARVEVLLNGKCDALVITPPEALYARRMGCNFVVDYADYGLNYALGGLAARRDYVTGHEDIIRRIVKAYVEGMHRYRTDRRFTIGVQQEYSGIEDRTIAEDTYDMTQPGMPPVPRPMPRALGKALEIMSRDLPAAKKANPSHFVDDRFIQELEESGFVAALSRSSDFSRER